MKRTASMDLALTTKHRTFKTTIRKWRVQQRLQCASMELDQRTRQNNDIKLLIPTTNPTVSNKIINQGLGKVVDSLRKIWISKQEMIKVIAHSSQPCIIQVWINNSQGMWREVSMILNLIKMTQIQAEKCTQWVLDQEGWWIQSSTTIYNLILWMAIYMVLG